MIRRSHHHFPTNDSRGCYAHSSHRSASPSVIGSSVVSTPTSGAIVKRRQSRCADPLGIGLHDRVSRTLCCEPGRHSDARAADAPGTAGRRRIGPDYRRARLRRHRRRRMRGGDDSSTKSTSSVAAAEAKVATAQSNLTDAQKQLTSANEEFCSTGKDYVTTVDGYGKAFSDAQTTVGDVKTAGKDLVAPRIGDLGDRRRGHRSRRRRARPEGTRGCKRGAGEREGNRLERAGKSDQRRGGHHDHRGFAGHGGSCEASRIRPHESARGDHRPDRARRRRRRVQLGSIRSAGHLAAVAGRSGLLERRTTSRSGDEGA